MLIKYFLKNKAQYWPETSKNRCKKLDPNSNRVLFWFLLIPLAGTDRKIRPRLSQMFYKMAVLKISSESTKDHLRLKRFSSTKIIKSSKFTVHRILRNFKALPQNLSAFSYMLSHIWEADHIPSNFIKAVFHKFLLVHSWIRCPACIFHRPVCFANITEENTFHF